MLLFAYRANTINTHRLRVHRNAQLTRRFQLAGIGEYRKGSL